MTFDVARVAEMLRTGKKQQGLSDARIADEIERLTGSRPSLMWVSRRLHGHVPVLRVAPEFYSLADVLHLDAGVVASEALFGGEAPPVGQAYALQRKALLSRLGLTVDPLAGEIR